MHRPHFLRWLALALALFCFQCLESLSDDCRKTLTCDEELPVLGADCAWHFSDGSLWEGGPRRTPEGRWLWPNGTETLTQDFECPLPDAGLGDAGLGGTGNCPEVPCDESLLCEPNSGRCVKCLTDEHCASASDSNRGRLPHCDLRRFECVVCLRDEDCGEGLNCKVDPANGANNRCVDCLRQNAGQCEGNDVCDLGSNECTSTCTGTGQCRAPKPICSNVVNNATDGLCVECTDSSHCDGATNRQCNTARKECVECVDDTGCSGGLVCNSANRCVTCVDDSRCNGQRCDLATNTCVECLNDAQCTSPDRSRCNIATHQCEPCNSDTQCEPGAPVCNSSGRCVSCKDDTTCASIEAPHCEVTGGICVACLATPDCDRDPTLARCENNACEFCTSSTQCTGKFGVRNLCRMSNGECVQCVTNSECAGDVNNSRCDQNTGLCARCQADGDCSAVAGRRACTGGNSARCVECVNATHCTGNPNGAVCNTASNTCVQCLQDTDCRSAGASRCVANRCQPCVNDGGGSHCGHIVNGNVTLGVCDTSAGANAGVCVQCTGPQRAACPNNTVCNSLTKQCSPFAVGSAGRCQDCVSDAHCAANHRCVQERFNNSPIPGSFSCFPVDEAGDCPDPPFSGLATLATVDGVSEQVCMFRSTTCAGLNQFNSQPCTANANCGETGLDDGRCNTGLGLCTIPCTAGDDCLSGVNADCAGDCRLPDE